MRAIGIATARRRWVNSSSALCLFALRKGWCAAGVARTVVLLIFSLCYSAALTQPTPWRRHEEMSNSIIFYINAWDSFHLPAGYSNPDMGTVTVSRRGVVNVRLGWHDGVEWTGNADWVALVDEIRDLLLTLC